MEEFKPTENTLANWTVNKTASRMLALTIFFVPFAIFILSFVTIYFILKSTDIFLLAIPIVLFLPVAAAFREFWSILSIYKEDTAVYLTDSGVYVRFLEHKDKYAFKDWYSIKQYDIMSFPQKSIFEKMIAVPTRFVLKGDIEEEYLVVDAVGENAEQLRSLLNERNIPFGFKTS